MLKQKTALIILYAVLAILVLALIAQIGIEKEFNGEIVVRTLIPMGLCVSAIVKIMTGGGARFRNTAHYEREYAHILRRAFAEQGREKHRKKLIDALNYYNRNQNEKAADICDRLLPICATTDDVCAVLMVKALAYSDAGLTEGAIDLYFELLRQDETRATAWSNLGVLLRLQGKNPDAISCFENAVKHDPQYAMAYSNLANVYFAMGYYGLCIENAKKALEIKSNTLQAMTILSGAYAAMGNEAASETYFHMAIQNGYDADILKDFLSKVKMNAFDPEILYPLDEAQKKAIREIYSSTAIPMLRIGIPAVRSQSRIGGHALGEVPTGEGGEPLRLLCAIYCSEVRGIPDFPEKGILQFFIRDAKDYGLDRQNPTEQKNFRVLYSEDETLPEMVDRNITDSRSFPVMGISPILYMADMCAMTDSDFRFQEAVEACFEKFHTEVTEDIWPDIQKKFHLEGHKIGGYPYFVREDPRATRPELRGYDTLLLQVDTHDGLIEIGRTGVMNFFISKENLKAKNFSDILYWWDEEDR